MSDSESLRQPGPDTDRVARRHRRADRTRKKALSPLRILSLLAALPLITFGVAVSVYLRTSPFSPPEALQHLVALGGCDAARTAGVAPARFGEPGYHPRHDPDGNGIACEGVGRARPLFAEPLTNTEPQPARADPARQMQGGAKFVRP